MNFDNFFLRSFRFLLFPFALIYGLIIIIRNYLYDKQIIKSASFNIPIIGVGNLSVGGTGKSPMVEYLIELLLNDFVIGTVSRGYKRKTRGYVFATEQTTALEIGDEPMQFHRKFPAVGVAVGEQRIVAIPQLLHDKPDVEAIILDDAFQHREIIAGLNILLTDCNDLFTRDFFLPAGNLRDQRSSYKRADIIIVTKCPPDISSGEREKIIKEIKPKNHQQVFFTAIDYGTPYHITSKEVKSFNPQDEVLLVYGIANPGPLKKHVAEHTGGYIQQEYGDHHIFTIDDLRTIKRKFNNIQGTDKFIITTEKDAVRLFKFNNELMDLPIYVLPIRHKFLFDQQEQFNLLITGFVSNNKKPEQV